MHQRDLRVLNLAWTAFAAQLLHGFGEMKHRARMTRMAMGKQTAVRVDRKFPAEFDAPALDEAAALTLGAEAEVLEFDNYDGSETIAEFGDVEVFRSYAGD